MRGTSGGGRARLLLYLLGKPARCCGIIATRTPRWRSTSRGATQPRQMCLNGCLGTECSLIITSRTPPRLRTRRDPRRPRLRNHPSARTILLRAMLVVQSPKPPSGANANSCVAPTCDRKERPDLSPFLPRGSLIIRDKEQRFPSPSTSAKPHVSSCSERASAVAPHPHERWSQTFGSRRDVHDMNDSPAFYGRGCER